MLIYVFVLICVCVRAACARASVRACMRACVSACACGCAFLSDCVFALVCVCSERVRAPRRCARPPIARRRLAVSMARPAPRVRGRARAVAVRCHRPGSRTSAAGVNWTCRTAKAQWDGRDGHTSVVDAAGAIYVIGGLGGLYISTYYFQDVWASTDGGALPDAVRGWVGGVLGGYSRVTCGGTKGY